MNKIQFLIIGLSILFIIFWKISGQTDARSDSERYQYPILEENKTTPKITIEGRVLLLIVGGLPLLMGIWATNTWFKDYNLARSSLAWVKVEGTLLSKKIAGCDTHETGHQLTRTYFPDVKYEFVYDGETYNGWELDYLSRPCYGAVKKSQKILDMLPEPGGNVDVYFGVKEKRAVLMPGTKNMSYFGIITGIVLLMIGSLIYRYALG